MGALVLDCFPGRPAPPEYLDVVDSKLLQPCISSFHEWKPVGNRDCEQCPVRDLTIFSSVEFSELQDLHHRLHVKKTVLPSKKMLYCDGDRIDRAFIVFDGWLILFRTLVKGKRQIFQIAMPGDLLLFNSGDSYVVDHGAEAVTGCTLCAIPLDDLSSSMNESTKLSKRMTAINFYSLVLCREHLVGIGRKDAEGRIAFLLLELLYRLRRRNKISAEELTIPLTQEQIADTVGLSPIHVNRVLRSMQKKKLLDYKRKSWVICDEASLAEIGEFDPRLFTALTQ